MRDNWPTEVASQGCFCLGLCPGRAAECPCQLTSRPTREEGLFSRTLMMWFHPGFPGRRLHNWKELFRGQEDKPYPIKSIMLHASVPRQFTSKIPQDPPPEKIPAQLIDCFAPKLFFSGGFCPNFLTYFIPFSSLMVSWAQAFQAHLEPLQEGFQDNFWKVQVESPAVPRQSESWHKRKPGYLRFY